MAEIVLDEPVPGWTNVATFLLHGWLVSAKYHWCTTLRSVILHEHAQKTVDTDVVRDAFAEQLELEIHGKFLQCQLSGCHHRLADLMPHVDWSAIAKYWIHSNA